MNKLYKIIPSTPTIYEAYTTEGVFLFDHVPTDDEVAQAIVEAQPRELQLTSASSKEAIHDKLRQLADDWLRWQSIRQEAQARSMSQAAIDQATTFENNAWTTLVDTLTNYINSTG